MKEIKNKKILITGGASGIGKIMGELVLQKGASLIIWDIDQENLDRTISELSKIGKVAGYKVDVSSLQEVQTAATKVRAAQGVVDILINNAGIVVGKYFHEHSAEDIGKTMDINASAPMYVTLEFLPDMIEQNSGHICNIASSGGFISNPKMSVYVASKWAVVGWSDSLRLEMQQLKKNINITTVTPYYISTGMFEGVRSRIPILKPEKVARQVIKAIEKNKIYQSMPLSMHFIRLSQGVLPVKMFDLIVGKGLGVYKTMEHFEGRKK